ncbi:MAG TPA: hypothetical protein VEZ44_09320 [bacterium]|nr:hypothetical protein [bacterium]
MGGDSVRKAWMIAIIAAMALGGIASQGLAQAPAVPPTLPLSAVRPGMTGYGLTVIHGTVIQRFDVKILGILHGGPATNDLILFRAGGPLMKEAGGNAAGMSGSPIYIGDRMIGALSYGYQFPGPDADLSLATPIDQMLKVLGSGSPPASMSVPRVYSADHPVATPAGPVTRVLVMNSVADAAAYNVRPLPGIAAVAPTAVPLFSSGVSPKAFEILSRVLRRYNVVPHQRYASTRTFAAPPLQPGSSLGVELVRGDADVGAIGTVTYRRGDQILAFGHPFLNAGLASMLLSTAYIDTIVRALDEPFKEGSIGALVGTVGQDRSVGISGTVGKFPRTFGVRVQIRDADAGISRTLGAQVVRRPDLAEGLVPMAVLSLVQRGLDRVAGGSAQVRIALRAREFPGEVVREDLAYDIGDIATASALDVPAATQLLFGNFFSSVDPIDMTVSVTVTSRPNTALLVAAHPNTTTVRPGDTVRVAVALRPYGDGDQVSQVIQFAVPQSFPSGPAFLLVGTAGTLNNANGASPDAQFQALVQQEGTPSGAASLTEAIDEFQHIGKNTEVLVELVPEGVLTAVGNNANPGFDVPAGTSMPTRWVVLGKFQIPVTVR